MVLQAAVGPAESIRLRLLTSRGAQSLRPRVAGEFLRYILRQRPPNADEIAGQIRRCTVLSVLRPEFYEDVDARKEYGHHCFDIVTYRRDV